MRDVNYERLTKRAIAIYARERVALVDGDDDALRDCNAQKAELLDELSGIEKRIDDQPKAVISEQAREQLASLQAIIARRTSENGQLMRANKPVAGSIWSDS